MIDLSANQYQDLQNELDRVIDFKTEAIRKLIIENRRLDVLAKVLGYEIYPFHWLLIEAKNRLKGPWRMFLAPRGAGKSTIITVVDCVMIGLTEINTRVLIASRVRDQAKDILSEVKGCFKNEKFCEIFGDLQGDKWGANESTLSNRTKSLKEPTFMAAGADGPVTSKHFDYMKVDDLVDEKNARTQGERERIYTFFYKTLVPCLMHVREDGKPGEIDLIGTRYHPEDIYASCGDKDPKFRGNICEIPALVNENGERDPNGVSVVPEILPTDDLKALRISMGSAHFDSQYQQTTERMRGDIFKNKMFKYYEGDRFDLVKVNNLKVWTACDLAVEQNEQNDEYSDCTIGIDDKDPLNISIYILEIYHARIPYNIQIGRVEYIFETWDPIRFGIEANAFQKSRLFSVYREFGSHIGDRCVPILTLKDKVTRAWKLSAHYEAGRIIHPKNDNNIECLEKQLIGFPKLKHDDMFDSLDLAVNLGTVTFGRRKRKRKIGVFGLSKNRKSVRRRLSTGFRIRL